MQMAPVIVYLMYGSGEGFQLELTFSVASLKKISPNVEVVLVTNPRNERRDLPLKNLIVEEDRINEWTRRGTYNHMAKIYCMKEAMQRTGRPILYVDTDTVFQKDIGPLLEKLAPGHSLMDRREGPIGSGRPFGPLINRAGDLKLWPELSAGTVMYCAGILGLHTANVDLFDKVLAMTEELISIGSLKLIHTSEQLAFSVTLFHATKIHETADYIEHYYADKDFYRIEFERRNLRAPDAYVSLMAGPLPALVSPKPAISHRIIARLRARGSVDPVVYRSAYAAYLSAVSSKDSPALAEAWALRAFYILNSAGRFFPDAPRDFREVGPAMIDRCHWLAPGVRQQWADYWSRAEAELLAPV
jgi:hypothetical protein